jgi:hypothetical protein
MGSGKMYEEMYCKNCGGTIYIDPILDTGHCDTCSAVYNNGIIRYEEEEGEIIE